MLKVDRRRTIRAHNQLTFVVVVVVVGWGNINILRHFTNGTKQRNLTKAYLQGFVVPTIGGGAAEKGAAGVGHVELRGVARPCLVDRNHKQRILNRRQLRRILSLQQQPIHRPSAY